MATAEFPWAFGWVLRCSCRAHGSLVTDVRYCPFNYPTFTVRMAVWLHMWDCLVQTGEDFPFLIKKEPSRLNKENKISERKDFLLAVRAALEWIENIWQMVKCNYHQGGKLSREANLFFNLSVNYSFSSIIIASSIFCVTAEKEQFSLKLHPCVWEKMLIFVTVFFFP